MKKIVFIVDKERDNQSPTDLCAYNIVDFIKNKAEVFVFTTHGFFKKEPILFARIRQLIFIPFYPENHPFIQNKINKALLEFVLENEIDTVVSFCYPFCNIAAGNFIKKKIPSLEYYPIFIDGYSCGTMPKYLPRNYAIRKRLKKEKNTYLLGTKFIAMESAKNYFDEKLPELNISYLAPPLLNKICNQSVFNDSDVVSIYFTGYLYLPDRDPTIFLKILNEATKFLGDKRIRMVFIGNGDAYKIVENIKNDFNFEVVYLGYLSHDFLLEKIEKADFFLNLGVRNSNTVSGKIFEYISYCKPIISYVIDENDFSLKYLNEYSLSFSFSKADCLRNGSIVAKNLANFIQKSINKRIDAEIVKKAFYKCTPKAYCDVILGRD